MKPNSRKALPASSKLQKIVTGPVVAKIQGSIKKLGQDYQNASLILYNKESFQPIALHWPDENGNYQFLGLNTDLKTFIVAFDQNQEFNAVIQDNVVPK
ncbi:hypothetical protein [Acinetobacter indicus]|uniref:hypothetical protein n=1 Tax=Acinetobacter indicus TaxID=756892 RepID=UPI0012E10D02|nr:hypothetical protein [Acinetobacter indicus]